MLASSIPTKITTPWGTHAAAGTITTPIPVPSQQGITQFAASFNDGFPITTMTPGGWPLGTDANGIMNMMTAWNKWQSAGGTVYFDAGFAGAVGGYPAGAFVLATSVPGAFWLNTIDNNAVNPDTATLTNGLAGNWLLCLIAQKYLDLRYFPVVPATVFYVSTTGNDTSGDGLTSGTAWATVAHAIAAISGYSSTAVITIEVAAGTYTVPAGGAAGTVGNNGIAGWRIVGAGAGSTIFDATATGARGFESLGAPIYVNGLKVTAYYECFAAQSGGNLTIGDTAPVNMGGSAYSSGAAAYSGAAVNVLGNMTISGSYGNVFTAALGEMNFGYHDANVSYSPTITFSGATASSAVVLSVTGGLTSLVFGYIAFAGTPTGKKYAVSTTGGITGNGGGLALIPGTIAGTVDATTYGWTEA